MIFSPTQAAPGSAAGVGGEAEETRCGTDTDPIVSEEEEESDDEGRRGRERGRG